MSVYIWMWVRSCVQSRVQREMSSSISLQFTFSRQRLAEPWARQLARMASQKTLGVLSSLPFLLRDTGKSSQAHYFHVGSWLLNSNPHTSVQQALSWLNNLCGPLNGDYNNHDLTSKIKPGGGASMESWSKVAAKTMGPWKKSFQAEFERLQLFKDQNSPSQ